MIPLVLMFIAGVGATFIFVAAASQMIEGSDAKGAVLGWIGVLVCIGLAIFFFSLLP